MAEDDIYKSKARYERFVNNIDNLVYPSTRARYHCRNPKNIVYFKKLIPFFEARDTSYIRRTRLFQVLKFITFATTKELSECNREDVSAIVALSHETNKTVKSKSDVIRDIKFLWKVLLPEKDEKGRVDDTLIPYAVRHLKRSIDKSKEKLRNDRLTWEEFQRLVNFFARDVRIQAYITLAMESLGRPQEILYTKLRDYEFHDNFAKVWISEHGKEGTGFLQCIDSYPYVVEWFKKHPFKSDPNAFFFVNLGNRGLYGQMNNLNINKQLKHACKALGIDKHITCYSLKRNGVTFCRQRGDTDLQIQHKARWTSTKQLKIYDMSTQEDALTLELKKRGLMSGERVTVNSTTKQCTFCNQSNGFTADFCTNCKRPLDREKMEELRKVSDQLANNQLVQRFAKLEKMFGVMIKQNA